MPLWVGRVDVLAAAALAALLLLSWALVRCLRRRRLAALRGAGGQRGLSPRAARQTRRAALRRIMSRPAPFRSLSVRVDSGGRRWRACVCGHASQRAPIRNHLGAQYPPQCVGATPALRVDLAPSGRRRCRVRHTRRQPERHFLRIPRPADAAGALAAARVGATGPHAASRSACANHSADG